MTEKKDIKQELLARIRAGEISMHSSGYFALRVAGIIMCALLALIISVLIFNFIFFSFRLSEQSELLGFGPRGFFFFFVMFPWKLLILDIVLLFAAERLLRHFRLGYRHSVLTLLMGLTVIALAFGFALDRATPFNDGMLARSHGHHLGPIDDLYEAAPHPWPLEGGVCKCVIDSVDDDTVLAHHTGSSSTVELILPPGFATSTLHAGDTVFIAGDHDDDDEVIRVFGIHARPPAQAPQH